MENGRYLPAGKQFITPVQRHHHNSHFSACPTRKHSTSRGSFLDRTAGNGTKSHDHRACFPGGVVRRIPNPKGLNPSLHPPQLRFAFPVRTTVVPAACEERTVALCYTSATSPFFPFPPFPPHLLPQPLHHVPPSASTKASPPPSVFCWRVALIADSCQQTPNYKYW